MRILYLVLLLLYLLLSYLTSRPRYGASADDISLDPSLRVDAATLSALISRPRPLPAPSRSLAVPPALPEPAVAEPSSASTLPPNEEIVLSWHAEESMYVFSYTQNSIVETDYLAVSYLENPSRIHSRQSAPTPWSWCRHQACQIRALCIISQLVKTTSVLNWSLSSGRDLQQGGDLSQNSGACIADQRARSSKGLLTSRM